MPSFPAPPRSFFVIDETNWNEYHYILPSDHCFYLWERMSRLWQPGGTPDYDKYPTNHFISNYQIPVRESNPYRLRHKGPALAFAAASLSALLPQEWRDIGTFVPMPPSKVKDDPDHDDRLLKTLLAVRPALPDLRELVLLRENVDSKQKGLRPEDRVPHYAIDENVAEPQPPLVFLFDDVLTTGCHFKAVQAVLADRFTELVVCGLFLARAVRPTDDVDVYEMFRVSG